MRKRELSPLETVVAGAFLVPVYLCWLAMDVVRAGTGWLQDRIRKR